MAEDAFFAPVFANGGSPTLLSTTPIPPHLSHLISSKEVSSSHTLYYTTHTITAYTHACLIHTRSLLITQLGLGELTSREIEAAQRKWIDLLHNYNE
jgi:hypothetical protein